MLFDLYYKAKENIIQDERNIDRVVTYLKASTGSLILTPIIMPYIAKERQRELLSSSTHQLWPLFGNLGSYVHKT